MPATSLYFYVFGSEEMLNCAVWPQLVNTADTQWRAAGFCDGPSAHVMRPGPFPVSTSGNDVTVLEAVTMTVMNCCKIWVEEKSLHFGWSPWASSEIYNSSRRHQSDIQEYCTSIKAESVCFGNHLKSGDLELFLKTLHCNRESKKLVKPCKNRDTLHACRPDWNFDILRENLKLAFQHKHIISFARGWDSSR